MNKASSMIKARRLELGFTLRDVEKITGGQISNAYLSQLENGKIKSPSLRLICALSAAYAVSVETLHEWLQFPAVECPPLCPTCGRLMIGASEALVTSPAAGATVQRTTQRRD